MAKGKDPKKLRMLLRILDIFHAYGEINAGRILKILDAEGFFSADKKEDSKRRLLNYYLSELEALGYIGLKGEGRGARWYLKKNIFKDGCFLLDEQKALFVLSILNSEDLFFNSTFEELANLMSKLSLSPKLLGHLSLDPHVRYFWGVNVQKILPIVSKIILALEGQRYISALFKGEKVYHSLLPISLGMRRGRVYLVAIEGKTGKRKVLPLEKIDQISLKDNRYKGKHFPSASPFLTLPNEEVFIFGMELNKKIPYNTDLLSFSRLIFHYEIEGDILRKIYMVGFTGEYFASRFVLFLNRNLIPPSVEIIRIAKKKKVDKLFPGLSSSVEVNRERFDKFLERMHRFIEEKSAILQNYLNDESC
jgi:hypothetical protein